MPLKRRASRPSASNGIGAGSKTTDSYSGVTGASLRGAASRAAPPDDRRPRPPREEPPRRAPCFAVECVELVFKGLTGPEGDDSANRVVGRDADSDAIAGDDLDTEAAHPAAQLGENFVTCVALDAIKAARMDGNNGALHINQIVFAQQLILST
jgi:hypothetical protein